MHAVVGRAVGIAAADPGETGPFDVAPHLVRLYPRVPFGHVPHMRSISCLRCPAGMAAPRAHIVRPHVVFECFGEIVAVLLLRIQNRCCLDRLVQRRDEVKLFAQELGAVRQFRQRLVQAHDGARKFQAPDAQRSARRPVGDIRKPPPDCGLGPGFALSFVWKST